MTGVKRTTSQPLGLTPQMQQIRRIAAEDTDKFIQSQMKVVSKTAGVVPFHYSWTQQQIVKAIHEEEALRKPLRMYVLKSRRIGSSTYFSYRHFVKAWARDNIQALILGQFEERAEELMAALKFAYASMPPSLKLALSQDSKDAMQFADTRGKLTIATARNLAVARGGTKQLLLLTEFAWMLAKMQLDVLVEFSEPIDYAFGTEIIVETTGVGYGSPAHQLWVESKNKRTSLRALFLAWQNDPASTYEFLSDHDRDMKMGEVFEYEPRMRDRMRQYHLTPGNVYWAYSILKNVLYGQWDKFIIDFPCDDDEPWRSTQPSFFGSEHVQQLKAETTEYPFQYRWFKAGTAFTLEGLENIHSFEDLELLNKVDENADRPFFKVWGYPKEGHEYVGSADAANGIEAGDFSSMFFGDMHSLEMMCEFHGKVRPDELGHIMAWVGRRYNYALLAPEINPPGNITFMTLKEVYDGPIYVYKHPYMDKTNPSKNATQHLAWQTNHITRPTMLGLGYQLVQDLAKGRLRAYGILKSRELLKEMATFADNGVGKPEAINGAFDDRVMAWCIFAEVCRQETHNTDRNILALYKAQTDTPQQPQLIFDPAKAQRDPAQVIQSMSNLWTSEWQQEKYYHV